ncbi:hypothetical protein KEJ47_08640 [Candidatus Bathyarchaeota archaeon]|nr:hypothetical protein [Candidatus Bathyarchaeota archaeon]
MAEVLLRRIRSAIKRVEGLGESEEVRVFVVDAITKMAEMEIMLLQALEAEEPKQSNLLARRTVAGSKKIEGGYRK